FAVISGERGGGAWRETGRDEGGVPRADRDRPAGAGAVGPRPGGAGGGRRGRVRGVQPRAVRLGRGERDADDAVENTLVAALEHPPTLDRDVRPWLARVLANFTRSEHRAEGRRRQRETEVAAAELPHAPAADDLLVRHEAARVVAGLVSGLREPHRTL